MGTCYYLINHRTKSIFEFGKGGYHTEEPSMENVFVNPRKFRTMFFDSSRDWFEEGEEEEHEEFVRVMAGKVAAFVKNTSVTKLQWINDCSESPGDFIEDGYTMTHSRFNLQSCFECDNVQGWHRRACSYNPFTDLDIEAHEVSAASAATTKILESTKHKPRFEYTEKSTCDHVDVTALNEFGEEGWKLVSISPDGRFQRYLFVRELL